MKIAIDRNQTIGSHEKANDFKHRRFTELGVETVVVNLPYGDYTVVTDAMQETIDRRGDKLKKADLVGDVKASVDAKTGGLQEVYGNIVGKSHNRFRDECILAQKCGCKLYILVEEYGIHSVDEVYKWNNPRYERYCKIKFMHERGRWLGVPLPNKPPQNSKSLLIAMKTMSAKYGIEWVFTTRQKAAEKIIELLGANADGRKENVQ